MNPGNGPSDGALLERTKSLCMDAIWAVELQHKRLEGYRPGDDWTYQWADFQFLVVALRRLRRAATIAQRVDAVRPTIEDAVRRFDGSLPALAKMRNVGEHLDVYALDTPSRHDKTVVRGQIQVVVEDGITFRWLETELNIDEAMAAASRLTSDVQGAIKSWKP
jgi:hypothetical protein